MPINQRELLLHGHRVSYREAGEGNPNVVLLLHGIASNSSTWDAVIPRLGETLHVLAPDLLGHGQSAKPRGDYSLGAYASGLRDVLARLGHDRVTVVGHSLGGGVAMQFAYQYAERCERLVLVNSGGLGRSVSPALRAAALPGAELVLPVITERHLLALGQRVNHLLTRLGITVPGGVEHALRSYASLGDLETRRAFLATLRSVVDVAGQKVDARDRLYLTALMPTLVVWGARDAIIPVAHGRRAHELAAGSRLEVFERAGHFPHVEEPERFVRVLRDFLATTTPMDLDAHSLHDLLARGSA